MEYHIPVLLEETVSALNIDPEGIYLDGTAGGGGHSYAIASRLTTGKLIALDQDPDAIAQASGRLQALSAVVVQSNFADMGEVLQSRGIDKVNGILLDIGVSSHQLDDASRGFSYHEDAPLDMRMSQSGMTAAELVATLDKRELLSILYNYGEEKHANRIAEGIIRAREKSPVETTAQLADIISGSVPAAYRRDGHPARKTFQALRIAVNAELEKLSAALDTALDCLAAGGRFAVITFHSLEDRMVKQRFAAACTGCTCPPDFPICVCGKQPKAVHILRKPVTAGAAELERNPRSRSAKLRCIEKL